MLFRFAQLQMTLTNSKGQGYEHFDSEYLVKSDKCIFWYLQSDGEINKDVPAVFSKS